MTPVEANNGLTNKSEKEKLDGETYIGAQKSSNMLVTSTRPHTVTELCKCQGKNWEGANVHVTAGTHETFPQAENESQVRVHNCLPEH